MRNFFYSHPFAVPFLPFGYRYEPYHFIQSSGSPSSKNIAVACMRGGPLAPDLKGVVYFKDVPGGTEVYANISGLPPYLPGDKNKDPIGPHGFHIHEKGDCTVGNPEDPFRAAGEHWNPTNQPHGNHAGDFPVLFSNDGIARMTFFTNKFKVQDIIGKAVIIHQSPDDYRTQPAGDAGKRLACGIIQYFFDGLPF
ncbi:superoxide dismutase family protein [Thermotalea metallivorans]|uniref:Superoxide dismutase [Cu-Zn] n=1 Tax=Thermotalea metallivorans TaxID=520762 RepID=A0A140L2Q2_9FIRM|nr:superoxide dismutase family protein [Thermotalea metallivorans]KXG74827.1 Superoxide dismutase [Cu-Zn] [Thermotalea metallivorans]